MASSLHWMPPWRETTSRNKFGQLDPHNPSPQPSCVLWASCRIRFWDLPVLYLTFLFLSGRLSIQVLIFSHCFATTAGENKFFIIAKTLFCQMPFCFFTYLQGCSSPYLVEWRFFDLFYLMKQKVPRFTACRSYAKWILYKLFSSKFYMCSIIP